MLATIPFPFEYQSHAKAFMNWVTEVQILQETRGDKLELVETPDDPHFKFYVVVHTGNIRGMIADLEEHNFLS